MESKMFVGLIFCLLFNNQHLVQSAQIFDVLKYGAKADGTHKNTAEIAKAIAAASAAPGGGIVHFPAGHYLTGPIHLRSNVTLQLDDGVLIKFSDTFEDYYPMVTVRWEGTVLENFSPLIYGANVSNVAIVGHGNATLDGSGEKWWDYFRPLKEQHKKTGVWDNSSKWSQEFFRVNKALLTSLKDLEGDPGQLTQGFLRPQFFHTIFSDHVTVENVTFQNSPFWNLHPCLSDYVTIRGVTVKAPGNAPNTDGMDPDSCRFVEISNCVFGVGDDCIVLKSGKNAQARAINRPSENITVTDCVMHTGTGFSIGSEMSGSIRNVVVRNLTFLSSDRGILIKTSRGRGGVVENVHISDIVMHNISHEAIAISAHFFHLFPKAEPITDRTPTFRNIRIENVRGEAKLGIQIMGIPERPFEQIELHDVHITAKQDKIIQDAHVTQTNVTYHVNKHLFDHVSFDFD